MTNCRGIAVIAALAVTAFSGGCGGPKAGFATVSGVVTVDGAPAESGQISFFPIGGSANPVGAKIVDGAYTVEAPVGEAKVEVRVPKVVGEKSLYGTPDSPVRKIFAESLPDNYNNRSELRVEVDAGENVHDFDLSAKTKKTRKTK